MRDLRKRYGIGPLALEFLILTAARTAEVLGARWDEIDLAGKVWVIPAERMKAGSEHQVPLSPRAIAIVREMATIRRGEFVFPGRLRRPLSNMALLTVLRRMKRQGITVHGFRSCFRDWATEHDKVREVVAEAALAHAVKGVEGAYRRATYFDGRVDLMQRWADYCDSRVTTGRVITSR
jgi:integrase